MCVCVCVCVADRHPVQCSLKIDIYECHGESEKLREGVTHGLLSPLKIDTTNEPLKGGRDILTHGLLVLGEEAELGVQVEVPHQGEGGGRPGVRVL